MYFELHSERKRLNSEVISQRKIYLIPSACFSRALAVFRSFSIAVLTSFKSPIALSSCMRIVSRDLFSCAWFCDNASSCSRLATLRKFFKFSSDRMKRLRSAKYGTIELDKTKADMRNNPTKGLARCFLRHFVDGSGFVEISGVAIK